MPLRTYHVRVDSYLVSPEELEWVETYAQQAIAAEIAKGKEIKNPKSKAKYLKAYKLGILAFARLYGLDNQLEKHLKLSVWNNDTDFQFSGNRLRIATTPLDERFCFGSSASSRVWEKDYFKGHTGYVLAGWFCPYVDVIGWLPRDELRAFKEKQWFSLQEPAVRPIDTLPGLARRG